jgi:GAF domain-containing protein
VIDEGFVAFGVVPMQAGTGIAGALAVASRDATNVSEGYARLLSQVAGELAIVLDNHRQREELRGAAAREAVARVVYDEVIQSLLGIGLRLQAALDGPGEPLAGTIQEMQTVIAEARSLIMQMERDSVPGADAWLRNLESVLGAAPHG